MIRCPYCSAEHPNLTSIKSHMITKHRIRLCDIKYFGLDELEQIRKDMTKRIQGFDKLVKKIPVKRWTDIEEANRRKFMELELKLKYREIGALGKVTKTKNRVTVYVYKEQGKELVHGEYVRVRPIGVTKPIKSTKPKVKA